MKLITRKLVTGLILTGGLALGAISCRKDRSTITPAAHQSKKMATGSVIDPAWIDLRDKARNEFEFYFRDYYHTRNFLKEVDWDKAILHEDDGRRIMVFQYKTDETIKTDPRLMAIQEADGNTHYFVRIKSRENNGYTSFYNARDKKLTLGFYRNNAFEPIATTTLKTRGGNLYCVSCHHDDGEDPVPGGTDLDGDNWLNEVIIKGDAWAQPVLYPDWWEGTPFVIIPPQENNVDNDPCATFENVMNNPAMREKLQQLLSNTTLNHETAFTFNGNSFSPFAHGAAGVDHVDIDMPSNTEVWGHSHFGGLAPTFTPGDLQSIFQHYSSMNSPMGFVAVVGTPYGMYMLKVVNTAQFNTFGNNYLVGAMTDLNLYYTGWQITNGTNSGDNLIGLLGALHSGLKITKIPNPNNPNIDCN